MSSRSRVSPWTRSLASLVGLAAPAAAGNVLVVDAVGTRTFTDVQPAIDAAVDGDTILVRSGTYGAFSVANKALAIVGDNFAVVQIRGVMRVDDLSAGKTVVLENLKTTQVPVSTGSPGLHLSNDAGSVRLERCTFLGADGTIPAHRDAWQGALVESCADVAFTDCTLRGGINSRGFVDNGPADYPGIQGEALLARLSTVVLHDCTVAGADGDAGRLPGGYDGGWGGDGLRLEGGTVLASSCSFTGGDGGPGDTVFCGTGTYGGLAGFAMHLVGTGSLARIQACTEVGGTHGLDTGGFCIIYTYPPGPARSGHTFVDLPASGRYFIPSLSPYREFTTANLYFIGQAGDRVGLILSRATQSRFLPALGGSLLVQPLPSQSMLDVGTIPFDVHTCFYPLHIRELPPSVQTSRLYVQAVFTDVQGRMHIAEPSSLVILDQQF